MTDATSPFLNLQTCIYRVADLDAAKAWYTEVLGSPPSFDESFYGGAVSAGIKPSS